MSYGLRGCNGRLHGLGFTLQDLIAQTGIQDCNPRDIACVAENEQRADAATALWVANYMTHPETANMAVPNVSLNLDTSDAALSQYQSNIPVTDQTIRVQGGPTQSAAQLMGRASPAGAQAAAPRGGQLSFTTSRGGVSLYVGDTWLVSITGASPNSPVTVSGSGPGGSFSGTPMGSTDGNGNFSKSGTVGTGEIGSWSEQWAVGGASSGSFSFTVAAAPGAVTFGKTAGPAPGGPSPDLEAGSVIVGGFDLSKIPWWGWGLAAGAALFAFGGARGR
jgi:hypothetical protein